MPRTPSPRKRAKPGSRGGGRFFHIEVRPAAQFAAFRVQDVGTRGGVERVAGRRVSGSWETAKWLVEKTHAHVEDRPARCGQRRGQEAVRKPCRAAGARRRRPFPRQTEAQYSRGREADTGDAPRTAYQHQKGAGRGPETPESRRTMIRKLPSGLYRLYSRKKNPKTGKRRNLGIFRTRSEALQRERAIQYFKRH